MKRIENFLVYVEDLSATLAVVDRIIEMAEVTQAKVTFVGVIEPIRWWSYQDNDVASSLAQALQSNLEDELNELVKRLTNAKLNAGVAVYHGDPVSELIQAVLRDGYDILFKAPGQNHSASQNLSSVDQRLLRACPCPVAMLRPLGENSSGKILAAVDFDPEQPEKGAVNKVIFDVAVNAALAGFRELYVLHVWQLYGESALSSGFARISQEKLTKLLIDEERMHQQWLDSLVKEQMDVLGAETSQYLSPKTLLLKGKPREVISQQVETLNPNLLVLGSIARTGVSGLLMGNTAEAILNEVNCSVATVKPPGFACPLPL